MDQVKEYVQILIKYRFWVLSGLITIIGGVCWWMASTELINQAAAQQAKLDTSFTKAQGVSRIELHPNKDSHKEMESRISKMKGSVEQAWRTQYGSQANVLIWPADLQNDFIEAVKNLRHIEAIPPGQENLSIDLRKRYSQYIGLELPKLAVPIRSTWQAKRSGTGASTSPGGLAPLRDPMAPPVEDERSIVLWDPKNQDKLAERFDWGESIPSTIQVLYAQEDLWVLESLMTIIAQTNGDVSARYKAAIQAIESIDIAETAHPAGSVFRLSTQGPGVGRTYNEQRSADPAELRYVDQSLEPLPAARLRGAVTSLTAADAFLQVAKRMPVRLRLMMDIRRLNMFITECGNAKLPLEIRQVRINRNDSGAGTSRLTDADPSKAGRKSIPDPYLTAVDLFGIVYIYNPPSARVAPDPAPAGNPPAPPATAQHTVPKQDVFADHKQR